MGLTALLHTARDALQAQTYGVTVTSQNINNANTPGYVRREALLETRVLGNETYGTVAVAGLRRTTDSYLEGKHYSAVGMSAAARARDEQLSQLEAIFNDMAGAGIGDALDRISNAFQQLSVDPSDAIARQEVLSSLGDFVARSHETGDALASQRTEMLNDLQSVATQINQDAQSIADINEQIRAAQAQGEDASDLKDKRNQILLDLAPLGDIRVVEGEDGTVLVQLGNSTLVEGAEARKLVIDLSPSNTVRIRSGHQDGTGLTDVTSGISSGRLAGLIEARDSDLATMQRRLDTYVYDIASALNAQHALGFGLDGSTGLQLFDLSTVTSPPTGAARGIQVSADVDNQPDRIAASDSAAQLPGSGVNAKNLTLVFDQSIAFGGTRTASEGYSDLIGEVGIRRADSARDLGLRTTMESQFYQLKESATGVSLDEEMVALTRFQRAYQAASRILTAADELMQELLAAVR